MVKTLEDYKYNDGNTFEYNAIESYLLSLPGFSIEHFNYSLKEHNKRYEIYLNQHISALMPIEHKLINIKKLF